MADSAPHSLSLPALVVCEPATGGLRLAALTLLDRLLVALHRAGCRPIHVVCAGELPALKRSRVLGVAFEVVREVPLLSGPTLVASTDQLAQTNDVKAVLQARGRLVANDGQPMPLGVTSNWAGSVGASLGIGEEAERGNRMVDGPPSPWPSPPRRGDRSPAQGDSTAATGEDCGAVRPAPFKATGVARVVRNAAEAKAAERALWASLTSSSDGFVDVWFNRPVGRPLSKLIIHTPITPNQVSLTSILIGTTGGILFGLGQHAWSVVAAVLFQISAIVDCVDGDVARSVFKESALGKWLDIVGDQVVHASVFVGITLGLWRSGLSGPFLWLGGSAVLGGLIAFVVVVRGMTRKGEPNRRLQKLIDGATSRDFSVLVFALACANHLEWFLWMAAVGSHVFWVVALGLQLFPGKPERS